MNKTDASLILQIQAGNEEAFNLLFEQLYQSVYYSAYRICKSDDDAKEIAQQTFIQVHRSINQLKDPKTFDVWLHRMIVNKCYNLFARRKDVSVDPNTSSMLNNEAEYREYLIPKEANRRQSDIDVLNSFIDELPQKYRILLILTYYRELSMEEVAEIMDMPVGTVKSRLYAARNLLKKKVVEYEKKEGVQLDFKEITPGILTAAFFHALDIGMGSPVIETSFLRKIRNAFSGNVLQASAIGALSLVIAVSAGAGVLSYLNPTESHMRYLENEQIFEPLELDGVTYDTPYQVYYSLLVFAHCEVELKAMSKEELYHLKPLYDALKFSNCSYYRRLQEIGWEAAYLDLL